MMTPAVQIMLPRASTEPAPLEKPRAHPGFVILWVTLLALAVVMLWAAFRDPLASLTT